MIISRTPLRISFVGGGSDLKSYYQHKLGAVVSTTIDKYIYITVNKKFDKRIRATYSKTENVNTVNQVEHPLIRECMKKVGIKGGIEVTSMADIPSEGSGLGSSSAYTVGLLNALYAYLGKHASAKQLAKEAAEIEIEVLKEPIGKQDHYIAAYGGLQHIQFNSDESVFVDPIICLTETKKEFEKRLLLFYTGITRSASTILSVQSKNMASEQKKRETMDKMVSLTTVMQEALRKNKLSSIGKLLHKNWLLKKSMASGISNKEIDDWYNRAIKNGAVGGKILGAGGGGFLLFYVEPEKQAKVILALKDLRNIPFGLEPQGSKIIFVD